MSTFGLNSDQQELQATVRKFLESHLPITAVRKAADAGYDREVWRRIAAELGLLAVGIPEEAGGTGDSLLDQVVITSELGRALDPSPYLPSMVLVARTLVEVDDGTEWLNVLIEGQSTAAPAFLGPHIGTRTAATRKRDTWTVTGQKRFVMHAGTVDDFLVLADTTAGPGLFRIPRAAADVCPLESLDQTRPLAEVRFDSAPAVPVGTPGEIQQALARALSRASVLLAAEQVGGAERVLEMATQYAKTRVQFGRPIGSFQAIKHTLADVMLEIESAKSAVLYAGSTCDDDSEDLEPLAHLCQAVASDTYLRAVKAALQVHGAIGFTWEHDLQLFFKRASSCVPLLGSPEEHREALAAMLLDAPPRRGVCLDPENVHPGERLKRELHPADFPTRP